MNSFWSFIISPSNLPATMLLGVVLLYWIINLLGLIDAEVFEHDADLDHDHDGFGNKVLDFLVGTDLPITFVISIFALVLWLGVCSTNAILGVSNLFLALPIYLVGFFGALALTRIITLPLSKLYALLKKEELEAFPIDFSGKTAIVVIDCNDHFTGQAELEDKGSVIRLSIRTFPGKVLRKGEIALLVEQSADKNHYIADPYTA